MFPNLHVLIVDDDPDLRASLRDLLEDVGCSVTEASSGRQALTYLLSVEAEPSLIILDLKMPAMDGNKLLELLDAYAQLSAIPIIVLSGTNPEREPLSRPVAHRFVKPVTERELFATMERLSLRPRRTPPSPVSLRAQR